MKLKIEYMGINYGNAITTSIISLLDKLKELPIETYGEYISACETFLNTEMEIKMISKNRVPWSKVLSEYKNGVIYYNPRKYRLLSEAEKTGNMAHEIFHHLNYSHAYDYDSNRKYSVPYFMGYWTEFYVKKLFKGEIPNINEFLIELNRRK